ncbi:DUF1850 domain-containing protein [Bacillus sp. PS06]|uniref:DUF1850 domain-containing protein n=1 Tax=Bacillus sp. PS06 TaxID=2764176 RepID=UPI001CD83FC6|nr:DUF1850 domain-containing protein [Bacillus sp. PS06]
MLIVLLILLFVNVSKLKVSYNDRYFYLDNDTFEIGWIHSVEKEPWYETYEMRNDSLFLNETRFKTFGAGTPSDGTIIPSNDGFVHMLINQKMEDIHLFVSNNVKTTLYTEKSTIPLYELVDDYETVTIEVKKIPLWELLRGDGKW